MSNKTKKQLLLNLPYFIAGLVCTNLGEAWRIAEGADMSEKLLGFLSALGAAFSNPMPSLHPMDLLIGVCCGAGLRLAVYLKGKNAKKYRHGMEYGSARWGTQKDIEPFEDPVFANNVILTRTERLMMGNRPKNPANARNKNVLVVGGSGSGKTRFWLKPNLLQCHSSYVVTDPNGSLYPHLMEVEQTAENRMQQTMAQLLKQDPAPDKAQNQLMWVQHMNSLKAQAEELVLTELIYS